jgi:hypothetical protein
MARGFSFLLWGEPGGGALGVQAGGDDLETGAGTGSRSPHICQNRADVGHPADKLPQERSEALDQVLDKIHHLMKRWEQRITLRNLRLSDRFLKLELHTLLDLIVEDPEERWIACLEKIPERREPIVQHDAIGIDRKKRAVFVDIVKLMDFPEQIVPTFVWFERIDSLYSFGADTRHFGRLIPFVSDGILGDKKFDTPRRRLAGARPH